MVKRVIKGHAKRCNCMESWHFQVVVLSPTATVKNTQEENNFDCGKSLTHVFYHQEFTGHENNELSFGRAVKLDVTIMVWDFVLARRTTMLQELPKHPCMKERCSCYCHSVIPSLADPKKNVVVADSMVFGGLDRKSVV